MFREWDMMDLTNLIFISYSQKDRTFVEELVKDLKLRAFDIWIDQYEIIPGQFIRKAIEDAIKRIDIFLLILSSNSVRSEWVQRELDMIIGRERNVLIPIIIEECEIPLTLIGQKWIKFTEDYNSKLEELVNCIDLWAQKKKDKFLAAMVNEVEKEASISPKERSKNYAGMGKLALTIYRNKEAKEILEKSIELWSENWDAYSLLAISLYRLGCFSEAEEILNDLIKKNIQKARSYYNLACLYSRQAEAYSNIDRQKRDEFLDNCLENLSKSFRCKFVSWLKHYASRTDPIGDILGDMDLVFARRASSKIQDFFVSLAKKYNHSWVGRQIYGGGGGCIDGNMRVYVKKYGNIPICQVKCGDSVLSSDDTKNSHSFSRVWRKMRYWEENSVVINGRFKVTAAQLIHVKEKGWRHADELEVGDLLTSFGDSITATETKKYKKLDVFYHLGLEGNPWFFVENILVHNGKIV
jgi:tetratricopeptide (TPR) repeat protein